jgi:hypothetical protein
MNRLLIVAILLISTAPLYAQRDIAKLKTESRNAVGIIGGDKAKTKTYCQKNGGATARSTCTTRP